MAYINKVNTIPWRLWTPADIQTIAWYDAADANAITFVSNKVTQWNDKSGNTRDLVQATTDYQPAQTTLNSLNAVLFDGSNDRVRWGGATWSISQSLTIVVAATTKAATTGLLYIMDNDARLIFGQDDSATKYLALNASSAWIGNTALTNDVAFIGSGVADGANSAVYKDGAAAGTGNPGSAGISTGFVLGCHKDQNASWWNGIIAEVVIFSGTDTTNRQKTEGYLAWKWGTTANLDASHPYKSSPP